MDLDRIAFLEVGPAVGYAHTLVFRQHWFVTAHLSINTALGWMSEFNNEGLNRRLAFYPNIMSRAVLGYNSTRWFAGVSYINNSLRLRSSFEGRRYVMDTGNIRFNVARRFIPGPQTQRYLRIRQALEMD